MQVPHHESCTSSDQTRRTILKRGTVDLGMKPVEEGPARNSTEQVENSGTQGGSQELSMVEIHLAQVWDTDQWV